MKEKKFFKLKTKYAKNVRKAKEKKPGEEIGLQEKDRNEKKQKVGGGDIKFFKTDKTVVRDRDVECGCFAISWAGAVALRVY